MASRRTGYFQPPLEAKEFKARAEALGKTLAEQWSGDGVQSIDHVFRLPGYANYPNKNKRDAGQLPALVTVIFESDRRYTIGELETAFPHAGGGVAPERKKPPVASPESFLESLPEAFRDSPLRNGGGAGFNDMAAGIGPDMNELASLAPSLEGKLGDRGEWFKFANPMANLAARFPLLHQDLLNLFDKTSAQSPGYNRDKVHAKFDEMVGYAHARIAVSDPLTGMTTLREMAMKNGWVWPAEDGQSKPSGAAYDAGGEAEGVAGGAGGAASSAGANPADNSFSDFVVTKSFDESMLPPPGRFGVWDSIFDHIHREGMYPQKVYTTAAALMAASTLIGSGYRIGASGDLRLNLYVCLIGNTGSGKSGVFNPVKDILTACGAPYFENVASTEALQDQIFDNPGAAQVLDECSSQIAAMSADGHNSHKSGMQEVLLDVHTNSAGSLTERVFARDRKTKVKKLPAAFAAAQNNMAAGIAPTAPRKIQNPYFPVLWGTTETSLETAMSSKAAGAGLLGRIQFFPSDNRRPDRRVSGFTKTPVSSAIPRWSNAMKHAAASCKNITITQAVQTYLDKDRLREKTLNWADRQRNPLVANNVIIRATEISLKVAGIFAVCRDWRSPVIDEEAFTLAMRLVVWGAQRLYRFSANSAETPDEVTVKRIYAFLEAAIMDDQGKAAADRGWRKRTDVLRATRASKRRFDEAIGTMLETGDLAEGPKATTGRTATLYRLRGTSK